jgi:hypothetical protein
LGVRKRRAAIARPGQGWGSLTSGEMAVVEVVAQRADQPGDRCAAVPVRGYRQQPPAACVR